MIVELISVGTELLLGDILDTNSQYISNQLRELGIHIYRKVTIGDNYQRLYDEMIKALTEADMIITTGGLGPTNDDITKEVAMDVLDLKPVLHEESYALLEKYFGNNNQLIMINKKQAMFPRDAIVLKNDLGTAPGAILFGKNKKRIIVLPGPPREMIPMFENVLKPILMKEAESVLVSRMVRVAGIGEAEMAYRVKDICETSQNPTVAPYSKKEGLVLKITAQADTVKAANLLIDPVERKIREILGNLVVGVGGENLETVIGNLLLKKNLKIICAESITGGLVASTLINFPGISSCLKESLIVYSDEAKMKYLHVPAEILSQHTAVSQETCSAMIDGILNYYDTDIALATTGYAGPDGEEAGHVFIGVGSKGKRMIFERHYRGDRNSIRQRTKRDVLNQLRLLLLDIS